MRFVGEYTVPCYCGPGACIAVISLSMTASPESSPKSPHFVAPWDTEIDDRRVWKRIEYKALVNNAAVVKIVHVNYKDFSQRRDLWVCQTSLTPRLLNSSTTNNRLTTQLKDRVTPHVLAQLRGHGDELYKGQFSLDIKMAHAVATHFDDPALYNQLESQLKSSKVIRTKLCKYSQSCIMTKANSTRNALSYL